MERDLTELNAELAALIGTRFGVRAAPLDVVVRRAGRRMPNEARRAAAALISAQAQAPTPKLRRQLDPQALAEAEATLRGYLSKADRRARRKDYWLRVLTQTAFNIVILVALATALLVWTDRL